jgi:hypothetical protein
MYCTYGWEGGGGAKGAIYGQGEGDSGNRSVYGWERGTVAARAGHSLASHEKNTLLYTKHLATGVQLHISIRHINANEV